MEVADKENKMEVADEKDLDKGINVDSVLGELRQILQERSIDMDSDDEEENDENKITNSSTLVPNFMEIKEENGLVVDSSKETENMTSETKSVTSPVQNKFTQPIIFKTSIKRDPGSKLHDSLVQELSTVLKKRQKTSGSDNSVKDTEKESHLIGSYNNNKMVSRETKPVNKIFANKALLANLENHLHKTLQNRNEKPRSSIKDVNIKTATKVLSGDPRLSSDSIPEISSSISSQNSSVISPSIRSPVADLKKRFEFPGYIETKVLDNKNGAIKKIKTSGDKNEIRKDAVFNVNNDKNVTVYGHRNSDSLYNVHIKSTDNAGIHASYITITGCPFIQNIDEGGLPTATGDGLYRGEEDKSAVFYVDVGNRKGDLNVQVDGPNSIAKCSIDPSDTRYGVTYVPVEVGIFTITIKWNGREIPGSPFHPKVVDPRKVRVQGGWQQFMDANERVHLVVGEEKRLPFDISQAGPGKLRAEVVGPSASIPVSIDDHTIGQSVVHFTPEEEGNHYIHLFWADLALPNSPFLGYAIHGIMDANKVILMGRGLKEATVREEAEFIIDGSQAGPGTPEVTLTGVRAEIGVQVFPLGNGKFRCVYIPVVPGAYLLHITWNGRQLRGSPYKVNIIGAFYPNKVVVSGEGLRGCLYGKHMDIGIDTRKAGPGELTASCMGPATAAYCELEDHHDGTFYLRIKPQEIGRHVLQIKYGGEHVTGSPFAVKVGAQPDAGKVRVTGPGVEHGILANFQSRFIVETRGAGAGQLSVRIRGPKGAFQVEMFRESQKDRTILCRFDPVETGLYIIHVKWSGVDVPGSPFHVHIVDSQQELQQVLHEQSFGSSAVTPRSYAQWREEI